MTGIEPQLWTARAAAAITFYERGFGAVVLHRVGDGDDIVARLAVGDARFWVSAADPGAGRLDPLTAGGRTGRTLLISDDPAALQARALAAGATETAPCSRNMAGSWAGSSTRSGTSGSSVNRRRVAARLTPGRPPADDRPRAAAGPARVAADSVELLRPVRSNVTKFALRRRFRIVRARPARPVAAGQADPAGVRRRHPLTSIVVPTRPTLALSHPIETRSRIALGTSSGRRAPARAVRPHFADAGAPVLAIAIAGVGQVSSSFIVGAG